MGSAPDSVAMGPRDVEIGRNHPVGSDSELFRMHPSLGWLARARRINGDHGINDCARPLVGFRGEAEL